MGCSGSVPVKEKQWPGPTGVDSKPGVVTTRKPSERDSCGDSDRMNTIALKDKIVVTSEVFSESDDSESIGAVHGGEGVVASRASAGKNFRCVETEQPAKKQVAISFAGDTDEANAGSGGGAAGHVKHGRARRDNRGLTAVQLQLRTMAQQGAGHQDDTNLVSDSDDDEADDLDRMLDGNKEREMSSEVQDFLISALQQNFVFKGLNTDLLIKIVHSLGCLDVEPGQVIVVQGSLPTENDCMYILQEGVVDIVIAGGGQARRDDVAQTVEGHTIRIQKSAGWVFGDMTLLLNTPRSASVHASTSCTLWTISRSVFLALVMKHAEGARALRFARKLPLLKGLSDNILFDVAERLEQETYQDGEHIIQYGEKGEKLYIIRYGEVKVCVPKHVSGEEIDLARLGRGHFVGERTLITNKLRTADCVAVGQVKVLVMYKKDFLQLDSPLLGWMRDYEAMASVLKSVPALETLTSEQIDFVIDNFQREEFSKNDIVGTPDTYVSHISVIASGSLTCTDSNTNSPLDDYIKKNPGTSHMYFGEACLDGKVFYPGNIMVTSEAATLLTIPRKELFKMLSSDGSAANSKSKMNMSSAKLELIQDAMASSEVLKDLTEKDKELLMNEFQVLLIDDGEQIIAEGEELSSIFLLERGTLRVQGSSSPSYPGTFFGIDQLLTGIPPTKAVVADDGPARLLELTVEAIEEVFGCSLGELIQMRQSEKGSHAAQVQFQDLQLHRVVGRGQFGAVRMASHKQTKEVYALKSVMKMPVTKRKMVEHIHNERTVMNEANDSPFCVNLVSAYQDSNYLYMLQEWAPGGEMFNLLNIKGVFDQKLAKFYTACVILAYEHLHARGIVYRDLKPENLLIDAKGFLKMADFGLAKKIGNERTHTICGTPDYQAPEAIMHKGQGPPADWWALGVLIYEMLVGDPPFMSMSGDPWDTFKAILSGRFAMPDNVPKKAADLIFSLLRTKPEERLGCERSGKGAQAVMEHAWFEGFDWDGLRNRTMTPPYVPTLKTALDTSNFDNYDEPDQEPLQIPRNELGDFSFALWEWIDDVSE